MKKYNIVQLKPFGLLVQATDDIAVSEIELELHTLIQQHKLILLRNFKGFNSTENFEQYCQSLG